MGCDHYRWQLLEAVAGAHQWPCSVGPDGAGQGLLRKMAFPVIALSASRVSSAILWSLSFCLLPSPGRWPDWIRRRTWCTWRCGPRMDVSAASTRLGPGRSACSSLSCPNLHFNGLGRRKALSSIAATSILISLSGRESSGPRGDVPLK